MTNTTKRYYLEPRNGQKSFYNKAEVEVDSSGNETLYSYRVPIIKRSCNGELTRLYDGWSATTGRHIAAFCGLNKAEFAKLPYTN